MSILHRLSGVLLVIGLPLMLWFLQQSLTDGESYLRISAMLSTWPFRLLVLVLGMGLAHHLLAGVRHLLQDVEIGVTREGGRRGAWAVLLLVVLASVAAGVRMFQ